MNFDALKEQLRDQWQELSGKIQENPSFQTLKEKFEAQSQNTQRGIIFGIIALAVMFVLSFPYGYLSTSSDSMTTFEDNRSLIRDLLQASRSVHEPAPLPPALGLESLKSQVSSILTENRLIPEQIVGVEATPPKPAGKLAPGVVQQDGVIVTLKTLNLKQIVDLGHRFQSLNAGVKVMSLDIVRSAKETHYYDVVYKVVDFSLPILTEGLDSDSGKSASPGSFGSGRSGSRLPPIRGARAKGPPPPPPSDSPGDKDDEEEQ